MVNKLKKLPRQFQHFLKVAAELAEKEGMPKFNTERIGIMADDAEVPSEILTFDKEGNKTGLSLVGWIGYLQAALKEAGNKIAELEAKVK